MRKIILATFMLLGCLIAAGQTKPVRKKPQQFTIVVYHDECTECGDFEIESGEVVVPPAMRERHLQAFVNSPRSGLGDYPERYGRLLVRCNGAGWRVGNVKLESETAFDALFLLPGKKRSDYMSSPWDFNRRYRATVEVIGIKWSYLTVRVVKAVRLADRKD